MYLKYIKRMLDLLISLVAFLLLLPLLIFVALCIKAESPGPVIFKQTRLGQFGRPFTMYKFRSMCLDAESTGSRQYSFKNDPRVTRVGKIIRATSIDELPQLVNIIKGEMSIIGFRPPLTYHPWPYEAYTEEQKKMFALRPGVTGWAQIHGRKDVMWEDRIDMGVYYADNVSFFLDCRIFAATVWKVLSNADNTNTGVTVGTKKDE